MLLKDKDYLSLVRTWMKDEKRKYAVSVYNLDIFKSLSGDSIHLTINYNSFLEMLLLRIREKTITYATIKKKNETEIESNLQKEIELLEEICNALNVTLWTKKN